VPDKEGCGLAELDHCWQEVLLAAAHYRGPELLATATVVTRTA